MTIHGPRWWVVLVGLVAAAALPVAAAWLRGPAKAGCALDGAAIEPAYAVDVVDAMGASHRFCCPGCARIWLDRQRQPPRSIHVTDETSGEAVEAAAAWYVSSQVVTMPATGNRLHVFRSRADADKHAARFGGVMLSESEKPFR